MLDGYNKYCDIKITLIDKADYDIVTELDYNIEKDISAEILKVFPEDRILGEEHSAGVDVVGRTWTIDPIDGTNNMANGIPLSRAVSSSKLYPSVLTAKCSLCSSGSLPTK